MSHPGNSVEIRLAVDIGPSRLFSDFVPVSSAWQNSPGGEFPGEFGSQFGQEQNSPQRRSWWSQTHP